MIPLLMILAELASDSYDVRHAAKDKLIAAKDLTTIRRGMASRDAEVRRLCADAEIAVLCTGRWKDMGKTTRDAVIFGFTNRRPDVMLRECIKDVVIRDTSRFNQEKTVGHDGYIPFIKQMESWYNIYWETCDVEDIPNGVQLSFSTSTGRLVICAMFSGDDISEITYEQIHE